MQMTFQTILYVLVRAPHLVVLDHGPADALPGDLSVVPGLHGPVKVCAVEPEHVTVPLQHGAPPQEPMRHSSAQHRQQQQGRPATHRREGGQFTGVGYRAKVYKYRALIHRALTRHLFAFTKHL